MRSLLARFNGMLSVDRSVKGRTSAMHENDVRLVAMKFVFSWGRTRRVCGVMTMVAVMVMNQALVYRVTNEAQVSAILFLLGLLGTFSSTVTDLRNFCGSTYCTMLFLYGGKS